MNNEKRTYYIFRPEHFSFSELRADTLDKLEQKRKEFGECPRGTKEHKEYWKKQAEGGKIFKVTEIREEVEA